MQKRQPVREEKRKPIDTNQRGGGHLPALKINKDRDDIRAVAAYTPGIKGTQQKRRKSWPYQD